MPRSLIRLPLCGLLSALLLSSQAPAPVFRAGSKLVEIEVTVLDKKGNPVTGLTAADFTLHDEGKLRPLAFFRFDGAPPSTPVAAPAPPSPADPRPAPAVVSNRTDATGESPLNICALVLDTLNTPPEQNVQVRAQMMRYLRALAPRTRVAIFAMGQDLHVLHDFTDDAASLRARLEKAAFAFQLDNVTDYTRSIIEAEQLAEVFEDSITGILQNALTAESLANSESRARRLKRTLAAMDALGKHLAGIPGRKNLVWIGAGFSMFSLDTTTGSNTRSPYTIRNNFESEVQSASRRLAQQGVILYIVDSKGLQPRQDFQASYVRSLPQAGSGRFERLTEAEDNSADPLPAMRLMAGITGGRYLFNTNDMTLGFQQVAADLRGSYTLGFYAPDTPDDKWHKVKVEVKRSGVSVRHREGYLFSAAPPQTPDWNDETWRAAFSNPVGSSAIPLTAALEPTAGRERLLKLTIGVDGIQFRPEGANVSANLQVAVGELTAQGLTASPYSAKLAVNVPAPRWEDTARTGISFQRQWNPATDATRLRVVVLDVNTGQYGSVDLQPR